MVTFLLYLVLLIIWVRILTISVSGVRVYKRYIIMCRLCMLDTVINHNFLATMDIKQFHLWWVFCAVDKIVRVCGCCIEIIIYVCKTISSYR